MASNIGKGFSGVENKNIQQQKFQKILFENGWRWSERPPSKTVAMEFEIR
jgi:hypothetical protein